MNGISKKQLTVFVNVIELGSVTEAARVLGMSQPSVSKSLALTERDMGFVLFERSNARMLPTPPALQVFEEARQLLRGMGRFDNLLEHVRRYDAGQLRVCATPALAINVLPHAAARFRAAYPGYGLVVDMFLNDQIVEAVGLRQYDLGFVVQPGVEGGSQEGELKRKPQALRGLNGLVAGKMVCVVPEGHALASASRVCWEDLDPRELIYITTDQQLIAMLEQAVPGFRDRSVSALETNRYTMAINLVRQGQGVTLVDEFALTAADRQGIVVLPFEPVLPVSIAAVSGAREVVREMSTAFIEVVRSLCLEGRR